MDARIPDWLLERYALGELPPERLAALSEQLSVDAEARARLEALRADDAAFLEANPPGRVVPALVRRASREKAWRTSRWALAAVPVLALAAGWFLVVQPNAPTVPEDPEVVRVKGSTPKLHILRSEHGHPEPIADGAAAHAGDVLQVTYAAVGRDYGVILSIDGRGTVTAHAGDRGQPAIHLSRGTVSLGDSYKLDDAPSFERFFFVAADEPFDATVVFDAAKALAANPERAAKEALSLPPELEQSSVILLKEHP